MLVSNADTWDAERGSDFPLFRQPVTLRAASQLDVSVVTLSRLCDPCCLCRSTWKRIQITKRKMGIKPVVPGYFFGHLNPEKDSGSQEYRGLGSQGARGSSSLVFSVWQLPPFLPLQRTFLLLGEKSTANDQWEFLSWVSLTGCSGICLNTVSGCVYKGVSGWG